MFKTLITIISIPFYMAVALFAVPVIFGIVYAIVHFIVGLIQGLFKDV